MDKGLGHRQKHVLDILQAAHRPLTVSEIAWHLSNPAGAANGQRQHRLMSFNHSARRKYFIARNTVTTAKSYLFQEPAWSARQGWRLAMDLTSIILFETNKTKKSRAFLTGMFHGIIGKMGPIEKTWPRGKD